MGGLARPGSKLINQPGWVPAWDLAGTGLPTARLANPPPLRQSSPPGGQHADMTKPSKKAEQGVRSAAWSSRAMLTMDDVARVTGFSQMTVSRAFLDSSPIKKETRDKILEAAAELGYFHNKTASSLASQRLRAFGIILPTLQDLIYLPFVAGAREVFEKNGADYLLQSIDYARKREPQAIGPLVSQRVRAILLPSIGHTRETEKLLRSIPYPGSSRLATCRGGPSTSPSVIRTSEPVTWRRGA